MMVHAVVGDAVKSSGTLQKEVMAASAPADEAEEYVPLTIESMQKRAGAQPAIIALSLLFGYLVLGVAVYKWQTDWTLLECMYYCVITLTSVGFGDLTPETDGLRLFTSAYILAGVGVLGTALGEAVSSLLNSDSSGAGRILRFLSGAGENTEGDENFSVVSQLTPTLITVAVTVLFGSFAFQYFDHDLTFIEALYYSVVTVSTVGYGDFAPKDDVARSFVTVFALFGTILLARSLAAIADIPLEARRKHQQQLVLEQYGDELDADELLDLQRSLVDLGLCDAEKGYCTSSDFALAMLVRQDKCSADDVKSALVTFGTLDIDGSGELDADDVQAFIDRQKAADAAAESK